MEQKRLIDANDIQREYGLSRPKIYGLLNSGLFPVVRLGKRLFVKREVFEKFLENGGTQNETVGNGAD